MSVLDPKTAQGFRFVRASYDAGVAELVYAFDNGPELIERIVFPDSPAVDASRKAALASALQLLHLVAGVSYFKAGVPEKIQIDGGAVNADLANLAKAVYESGLGEFAYQNGMDLRGKINFPSASGSTISVAKLNLPRRTLLPIGGGKDSLVSLEKLRQASEPMTAVWVGNSALIQSCVQVSSLDSINISREISAELFAMNRNGAYNGHIPVTAINSAILVFAAVLYGYDAIAFSNERSASSATLQHNDVDVNHQWSKGWEFEQMFASYVKNHVAQDLSYFSLLRQFSELAVTKQFAKFTQYHSVFSSCNRNFKILGERPGSRWCGRCPKCHFVFLALAPFVSKAHLVSIFARNYLDDESFIADFDALLEWQAHKPFECVGEGGEARAAMVALAQRAEWREDAIVKRFSEDILPKINAAEYEMSHWLSVQGEHGIPTRLLEILHAD